MNKILRTPPPQISSSEEIQLVSCTVKESAADFWYEIRGARHNNTWAEIQDVFRGRFANYVDAQIAYKQQRRQVEGNDNPYWRSARL